MTLTKEQMIGDRYRVVSLLGQGGMGAVYRAWDTRLNVPVALKEMCVLPSGNLVRMPPSGTIGWIAENWLKPVKRLHLLLYESEEP